MAGTILKPGALLVIYPIRRSVLFYQFYFLQEELKHREVKYLIQVHSTEKQLFFSLYLPLNTTGHTHWGEIH